VSNRAVKEYFLFDPHLEYLDPPLQGYQLAGDDYERIEPDAHGELDSRELGLRLRIGEGHLEFVRRDTGERLLTASERETERAEREAEARQRETQARLAAEAEIVRLRAELARLPPSAE